MMPLILLHGALGAAEQMMPLKNKLQSERQILCTDFSGHGHSINDISRFTIPVFAQDVIRLLDKNQIEQADIFGYSMGGYVGLYLAQHFPQRVRKIASLATKFFWTSEYAAAQQKLLDPAIIEKKLPQFAAVLAQRHTGNDWKSILEKTAAMMADLGSTTADHLSISKTIQHPALLIVGDTDNTVSIQETEQMRQTLANAQLAVLPGTPHPFEKINLPLLCLLLENFYA